MRSSDSIKGGYIPDNAGQSIERNQFVSRHEIRLAQRVALDVAQIAYMPCRVLWGPVRLAVWVEVRTS